MSPLPAEQRGKEVDQLAVASSDATRVLPSTSPVEPAEIAAVLPQPEVPAAPAPWFQEPVTVGGGASVEVLGNQRATVAGQATSLRSLVEEICRQARVELRAYTATDRSYAGHLQDLPLQDVFRSMFRSESYLVGLSLDPASREKRITWLQVLGTGTSTAGAQSAATPPSSAVPGPTLVRPPVPPPAQKFVLSPTLLYEAFGTMDPARREQAQREALSRLADPARRAQFLNTDPGEIANVVANYEHSAEGVRSMKNMTNLPDVQAKLDAVLNALAAAAGGEETN